MKTRKKSCKSAVKKIQSNWKKKKIRINNWTGDIWENRQGDIIDIDTVQDRDGKNAFMHKAIKTDRSSIGTARGKRTILAKGRNEKLLLKKLKKYMEKY